MIKKHNIEKKIRLMAAFLSYVMSFTVSAQQLCQTHGTYDNWSQARQICQNQIDQLSKKNNPQQLAKAYMSFANVAYNYKLFDIAEQLLVTLKNQQPDYLLYVEQGFHWYYLMGKTSLRASYYERAISSFEAALDVVRDSTFDLQKTYSSYALNGLGLSYKRINNYQQALSAYRQSLLYKKEFGSPIAIAKTLTNVATVYDLLEDHENALKYYSEAQLYYDSFDINKDSEQISLSHNYENLGVVYNKLHNYEASIDFLEKALNTYPVGKNNEGLVKIYTYIADSYWRTEQQSLAQEYYLKALIEDQKTPHNDPHLRLQLGQYYFDKNELNKAMRFVSEGLIFGKDNEQNKNTLSLLHLLKSQIHQQQNDYAAAIASLVQHNQFREQVLENKFNQDINNVTYQIEIEKTHFDLELLAKENQLSEVKINRQYWVISSFILLFFIAGLYLYTIFRKKSREKQRLLAAINVHKDQLGKMENFKDQLKEVFYETTDAILCVDSGWVIAFSNHKFNDLFNKGNNNIEGQKLVNILPELFETVSALPMDGNDMPEKTTIKQFAIKATSGLLKIDIRINTISLLDDFTVLSVGEKNNQLIKDLNSKEHAITHIIDNLSTNENLNSATLQLLKAELQKNIYTKILQKKADDDFRIQLVDLMRECVEIWSAHTKTNRIELADISGYWKVTIDDGRLRTRAMDRYLQVKQLPKNPRWRQVVKTAHYILSECELSTELRQKLSHSLESFLSIINHR